MNFMGHGSEVKIVIPYKAGHDVGELEFWPFDNPSSNYKITRGEPRASGRIDAGGSGYTWRVGVWRCTEGEFECNEPGDELQVILSGKVRLVSSDGSSTLYGPGDTFFTYLGDRVTWDVVEDVTKVFYSQNPSGF